MGTAAAAAAAATEVAVAGGRDGVSRFVGCSTGMRFGSHKGRKGWRGGAQRVSVDFLRTPSLWGGGGGLQQPLEQNCDTLKLGLLAFGICKKSRRLMCSAEVAQSGERKTEDLKVASSILAFRI